MKQQIRFCRSFDGTRIAYAVSGDGPPLVKAPHWLTHLEYEAESPIWREWIERLSHGRTLIRMDARGCGLSDRDVREFTFAHYANDLEAVIDAAGVQRFALFGHSQGGAIAVEYAARHPQRVAHLALLFWQWRPIPATVWRVEGIGAALLWGLFALGWLSVLLATFMINHFDLFGLRQVYLRLKGAAYTHVDFKTVAFYRFVRHPIMLGFLIAFWAAPHMTVGRLVFAAATTAYIFIGIWLEERDLRAAHGASFERYRSEVPMIVPRLSGYASDRGAADAYDDAGTVRR